MDSRTGFAFALGAIALGVIWLALTGRLKSIVDTITHTPANSDNASNSSNDNTSSNASSNDNGKSTVTDPGGSYGAKTVASNFGAVVADAGAFPISTSNVQPLSIPNAPTIGQIIGGGVGVDPAGSATIYGASA